ncbi:hypothetical protein G7009_17425 [Pseudomonas capeferrum]|nr:hypothetical protein [Pseudomonas capeferrum]
MVGVDARPFHQVIFNFLPCYNCGESGHRLLHSCEVCRGT